MVCAWPRFLLHSDVSGRLSTMGVEASSGCGSNVDWRTAGVCGMAHAVRAVQRLQCGLGNVRARARAAARMRGGVAACRVSGEYAVRRY
ncbi:hypothetical protein PUN4_100095 [Paraburkholderia unamae]|jgi:hypothetical protein|nr:hypothetical protein PUN4_100095 [Paraburkholderia unamae]